MPIRPLVENPAFMRVFQPSILPGFDSDTLTTRHFELPSDEYLPGEGGKQVLLKHQVRVVMTDEACPPQARRGKMSNRPEAAHERYEGNVCAPTHRRLTLSLQTWYT